jgi:type I restriction enzyme S subunit
MKQGWEIKKLGEVVTVLDNLRKPITKKDRVEGEYPYYGATGILSYVHNYIFSEKLVLIGEDGAKWASGDKTSFIADEKYWVNNHAHVIRPDRKIISDEWIVYFLNFSDLTPFITGMTVPKLNQEKMRSIPIPLPPLPEQQRIVAILDEFFAAIAKVKANTEQNLKNAKELFESYLQGVFENKGEGWEEKSLGDVCSLITDGKHGDCENEENSGYYFLSAKDVRNGTLLFDNARQITKSGFEETHRRTNLKPGDICMVNTGATIGRISFAPDDPRTYRTTFQKSVAVIKTIPTLIDNSFCCYILQSDLKKLVKVSSGTAVPNLLLGDLKRHKINLPKSKTEQHTIVCQFDALRVETQKLEALYQKKINDLEELKKSILQKAFAGELKTEKELA